MDIKKCKVGTRVQFEGTIIDGMNDEISVNVRSDNGEERYVTPEILEPATPRCDPTRKFRKGDIVKLDYKGRDYGSKIPEGTEVEVLRDECAPSNIKVEVDAGIDSDGWIYTEAWNLVLVKPIEEIEKEGLYLANNGVVERRDGGVVVVFSYKKHGRDNASRMAQKVCDELNREYKNLKNS